jgi:hypothetical protein
MGEQERIVVDSETGEVVEQNVAALAIREPKPDSLVRPAADLADIRQAFKDYQALRDDLLNDSDYQSAGRGKQFVKKSGWRKLAVAFGVTFEHREHDIQRDGNTVLRAEFLYRAIAPNGRFADGWAACDLYERCCELGCRANHPHCPAQSGGTCPGITHWSKPVHDIPATAETRAKNRAASDLFGMGEVSAEEVSGSGGESGTRRPSAPARPGQASEAQMRAIFAIAKKKNLTEADLRDYCGLQYGIESLTELTTKDASNLIDHLQGLKEEAAS